MEDGVEGSSIGIVRSMELREGLVVAGEGRVVDDPQATLQNPHVRVAGMSRGGIGYWRGMGSSGV